MKTLLLLIVAGAGCAHAKADGPPDTEVTVGDEAGEPLLGNITFWSRDTQDKCQLYGASCAVALPTGDYALNFRKERAGRPGSQIGGTVQSEKQSGCLRARVHLPPALLPRSSPEIDRPSAAESRPAEYPGDPLEYERHRNDGNYEEIISENQNLADCRPDAGRDPGRGAGPGGRLAPE